MIRINATFRGGGRLKRAGAFIRSITVTTVDNAAADYGNNDDDLEQQYASDVDENAVDDDDEDDFNNFIY